MDDIIWGNMPLKLLKSGRVQINAIQKSKTQKYKNHNISESVNLIKPKFKDKSETTSYASWVG